MGDDYQVIARAVRRPMQRWWRRVGVWWVALIAALQLFVVFDTYAHNALIHGSLTGIYNRDLSILISETVPYVLNVLPPILWILAAFRVLKVIDEMLADTAVTVSGARLTSFRFKLVLAQSVWPLLLSATHRAIPAYSWVLASAHMSSSSSAETLVYIYRVGYVFEDLVLIMWIAALMSIKPMPRLVMWLWWAAFFVVPQAYLMYVTSGFRIQAGLPMIHGPTIFQIGSLAAAITSVVSLGLIAASIRFMALQSKVGTWLGIAVALLAAITGAGIGPSSSNFDVFSGSPGVIDWVINIVYSISKWTPRIWIFLLNDGNSPLLALNLLGWETSIKCSLWWHWLPLPFQALIAYGYYWFIRWLLVLGASRRKVGT